MIGTGADGALPVLQQVRDEARRRKIDLIILPTAQAIGMLTQTTKDTNAILHLTAEPAVMALPGCPGGRAQERTRMRAMVLALSKPRRFPGATQQRAAGPHNHASLRCAQSARFCRDAIRPGGPER